MQSGDHAPAENSGLGRAKWLLRDVHDLVLEDKEVGPALASEANHVPVVVFDPALHDVAVDQLNADGLLLLHPKLSGKRLLRKCRPEEAFCLPYVCDWAELIHEKA